MIRTKARILATIKIADECQADTFRPHIAMMAASALASALALDMGSFQNSQTSKIWATICSRVPLMRKVKMPSESRVPLARALSMIESACFWVMGAPSGAVFS
jgi:hypothetical protein